jgi:hypothetical protein
MAGSEVKSLGIPAKYLSTLETITIIAFEKANALINTIAAQAHFFQQSLGKRGKVKKGRHNIVVPAFEKQ